MTCFLILAVVFCRSWQQSAALPLPSAATASFFPRRGSARCFHAPPNNDVTSTVVVPDTPPATTTNHFTTVAAFTEQCHVLVADSLKRFQGEAADGAYYSHVKEQMGDWINHARLDEVRQTLNDTCLRPTSKFAAYLAASPLPAASVVAQGDHFTLTLLFVPAAAEAAMPTHAPGTVVLYKSVLGTGELKGFNNQRVIQRDVVTPHRPGLLGTPVITRLGGPRRTLSAGAAGPATVLELAFRPRDRDGGIAGEQSVVSSLPTDAAAGTSAELASFTVLQPPQEAFHDLFEAYADMAARPADADADADDALFADGAGKYDIYERLQRRVGGLSVELGEIVRRVLVSRQVNPSVLRALGLSHVRGILLHGPPGTGKTLIAREIARALDAREPVLVNGPEIMDKYVGEAERNIRTLFQPAEEEWAARGAASELHVLIFDEFDAVAKRRGSLTGDGSGVRDSCVNQLLSKLDGVNEMNNVLVIALTNRKDLIDPALLRPGRLEVHVEIQAPDEEGRVEILYLLFRPLVKGGFVDAADAAAWSRTVAAATEGWTGADLSGLMRGAASFAIDRSLSTAKGARRGAPPVAGGGEGIRVTWEDIYQAMGEAAKDVSTGKRARVRRFLTRAVQRLTGRGGGGSGGAMRRTRTFEEILHATYDDEEEEAPAADDGGYTPPPPPPQERAPAFRDIGGTLMF